MDHDFHKDDIVGGSGAPPPTRAWLYAQALLGKSIPSPFRAAADARAKREHLEWLAMISTEHESQLRNLRRQEADARAERKQLEWLAQISTEHESKLRGILRAEAEAAEAQRRWEQFAESEDIQEAQWDPAKHPRGAFLQNRGWWSPKDASGGARKPIGSEGFASIKLVRLDGATKPLPAAADGDTQSQWSPSDSAAPTQSGGVARVSNYAAGEVPDIMNPASKNSVSRSFWEAIRRRDWRAAENIVDDIARFLDVNKLRSLRTALKRIRGLDKWRKQASQWPLKRIREEIKTLEKSLAEHLAKRGGVDTPETVRIRYQLDYLKGLFK